MPPHTLDGTDNFLLNNSAARAAQHVNWPRLAASAFAAVCELIDSEFDRVRIDIGDERELVHDWVIKNVETTWEFHDPVAPDTVAHLDEYLRSASSPRTTEWGDNISICTPVHKHVDIVVYAKALNRLRVEVRHKKSIRGVYQAAARLSAFPNRSAEDLKAFLRFIQFRSSERAMRFFDGFFETGRLEPDQADITHLVRALDLVSAACAGDANKRRRLLLKILRSEAIIENLHNDLRDVCEQLVRDRVLVRTRSRLRSRSRSYAISPRYSRTFRAIADLFGVN